MTTENTSALVHLHDQVKTYFGTASPGTSVVFGRRERWRQLNQGTNGANRVVLVPGKIPSGDDGPIDGPPGPGEDIVGSAAIPRPLVVQLKWVTWSIWAADIPTDKNARDEVVHQQAIEQMQEHLFRAVKHATSGLANETWISGRYNPNPEELRFGLEYLIDMTLESQYFDAVPLVAFPSGAVVSRGSLT